ncbi:MAG: hypothetical protein AAGE65_13285 [Planctomycetota bacterium]
MGAAPAAVAQAVPGASGGGFLRVEAGKTPEFLDFTVTADTTTAMLDQQFVSEGSTLTGQSLANLNIVYEGSIFVDVQTASRQANDVSTSGNFVRASATGVLSVHSRLIFKSPPPFVSDRYPATLFVPYAMADFGTQNAIANVTMRAYDSDGAEVFDETRTLGVDPAEGQYVLPSVLVEPDEPFRLELEANAFSSATRLQNVGETLFSEAQAIIGTNTFSFPPPDRSGENLPVIGLQGLTEEIWPELTIEFDQAAFDALHGENSFVLEDFLAFEFSTSLVVPGLAGDYNDSGQVEQGDLNLVLNNWGLPRPFEANAEPFATASVDQEELNRVLNNWGDRAGPPDMSRLDVPEPGGLAVALGLSGLMLRRRPSA